MVDTDSAATPEVIAGHYRVQRSIGRGGFGVVYVAKDERSESSEEVAVKVIPLTSARAAQQFRHEARALGKLDHPNVVRVVDVWDDEHTGALVMEYLRGHPLSALHATGSMSLEAAVDCALSLCCALEHAHARGVVHRDVSPRNVVVTEPAGVVKLIDFGFSVSEFSGLRAAGGTRSYAAPEQFSNPGEADPRSDVYGVGALLHYLLTGAPPARPGAAPSQTPGRPLPPLLASVVLAALEQDPAERYQTVRALADDLMRARGQLSTGMEGGFVAKRRLAITLAAPERVAPVGRDAAFAALDRCLERARAGRGSVVTVCANSGSGKSRLVRRFVDTARAGGALALEGGCLETGRSLPYGVLREALAGLDGTSRSAGLDRTTLDRRIVEAAAGREPELTSLAPWLAPLFGNHAEVDRVAGEGEAAQKQFLGEITQFLARLGTEEQPLVVWFDDVQWADASTLRFVTWLSRGIVHRRLLFVLSYREDGAGAVDGALAPPSGARVSIPLDPLSPQHLRALIPAIVSSPVDPIEEAIDLIGQASGGNPFAVWEVCRGLLEAGAFSRGEGERVAFCPWTARHVLAQLTPADLLTKRLGRLHRRLREGLGRAAVLGRRFSLAEANMAEATAAEAAGLGLIAQHGDEFVFTHDRVREAAHAMLGPVDRKALHRVAGLRRRGDVRTRALAVEHFAQSEDFDLAAGAALEAADDAAKLFALDTALAFHRRVLGWARSGTLTLADAAFAEVLWRAAELSLMAGRYRDVYDDFEAWFRVGARTPQIAYDPVARAHAYGRQAEAMFRLGKLEAANGLHEKALEELGVRIPRKPLGLLLHLSWSIATAAVHGVLGAARSQARADPRLDETVARLAAMAHTVYYLSPVRSAAINFAAINLADRQGPCRSKTAACTVHAAVALVVPIFSDRFSRYGELGVEVAQTLGDAWAELSARSYVVVGHFARGKWAEMHAEAARAEELALRVRDPTALGLIRQHVVYGEYCLGDLPRAIDLSFRVRDYYDTYDNGTGALDACFFLPQALAWTGKLDEAEQIARWFYEGSKRLQNRQGQIQGLVQQSLVAHTQGRAGDALLLSREACDVARAHTIHNVHVGEKAGAYLLATAAVRADGGPPGHPDWASLARGALEASVCFAMSPGRRAFTLWALGRALSSYRLAPLARAAQHAAVRVARTTGSALDEARAHAELGLADLARDPASERGLDRVVTALNGFQRCGAAVERTSLLRKWKGMGCEEPVCPNLRADVTQTFGDVEGPLETRLTAELTLAGARAGRGRA